MRDFKPMKELIKALNYIGDAVAGKVTSNTQNASDEYDGIIVYGSSAKDIFISSGIKNVEFSNIVKLGDIASKNLINDINALFNADWSTVGIYSKGNNNKLTIDTNGDLIYSDCCIITINESKLTYSKYNFVYGSTNNTYTLSDLPGNLTENTILTIDNT